eukprot:scaffold367_cov254-Pinguiococcus_pyrenoidosus.AAC.14
MPGGCSVINLKKQQRFGSAVSMLISRAPSRQHTHRTRAHVFISSTFVFLPTEHAVEISTGLAGTPPTSDYYSRYSPEAVPFQPAELTSPTRHCATVCGPGHISTPLWRSGLPSTMDSAGSPASSPVRVDFKVVMSRQY